MLFLALEVIEKKLKNEMHVSSERIFTVNPKKSFELARFELGGHFRKKRK